jgi:hypothetical protein
MGRACSTVEEKKTACSFMVAKPEGDRPRGRSKRRWIDNIKILERWYRVVWTGLIWYRIKTKGGFLQTPSGSIKYW